MILTELSAIAAEDLPVAQLKEHLRLGTGFAESDLQDGLCEAYLRASIATIEVIPITATTQPAMAMR